VATLPARPYGAGDFPELDELRTLIQRGGPWLRSETLCEISTRGEKLPVYCLELGSTAPDAPAVGFFGGVHGVERIGTQVVLAYLHTLIERLHWDATLALVLSQVRLVFVPLVNPGGMLRRTRSNPAGIDLMRNAPVVADQRVPFMLGGQQFAPFLPWYRGKPGAPMEPEAQAVCRVVEQRLSSQPFSIVLDCHSGFGARDYIWFPYAGSRKPIECLAEIYALRSVFRSTYPHHSTYVIEPQSRRYTTHGDLWDHLYRRSLATPNVFLPLTLELGSWLWIRKNPLQAFGRLGLFNPIEPHRLRRILRQHLTFLDFLVRAAVSHARWRPGEEQRASLFDAAVAYWMDRPASLSPPAIE
jgi:hypothetical protein